MRLGLAQLNPIVGDLAGKFRALDQATGKVLWEVSLGSSVSGFPISYSVNGKQYIAIAVGGGGLFSQGLKQPEAGPGKYVVFALGSANQ